MTDPVLALITGEMWAADAAYRQNVALVALLKLHRIEKGRCTRCGPGAVPCRERSLIVLCLKGSA